MKTNLSSTISIIIPPVTAVSLYPSTCLLRRLKSNSLISIAGYVLFERSFGGLLLYDLLNLLSSFPWIWLFAATWRRSLRDMITHAGKVLNGTDVLSKSRFSSPKKPIACWVNSLFQQGWFNPLHPSTRFIFLLTVNSNSHLPIWSVKSDSHLTQFIQTFSFLKPLSS